MNEALDTHAVYAQIARSKQREVKALVFALLGSAVAVSAVSALVPVLPWFTTPSAFYVLVPLFIIGIAAQIILQIWRIEDHWFQARAVAETAKSLSWEYMMGSTRIGNRESSARKAIRSEIDSGKYLGNDLSPEQKFVDVLKDLRREFKSSLHQNWCGVSIDSEISEEMRTLRASALGERKSAYLKRRIDDQIQWYERKAKCNKRMSRSFAVAAIALEVAGVGVAVYAFALELIPAEGVVTLIATLIASLVGWSQSRRYAELVEPYSYTSETLKELKEKLGQASNEETFSELVEESEHAISREHQMWQIRRGVTSRKHLAGG